MWNHTRSFAVSLAIAALAGCGGTVPDGADETVEGFTVRSGVDYSWARPSPSGLKSAGYSFVARYYSYGSSGKNLTAGEANSLKAAGVDIVSNWEYAADDALNGYNAGVADAKEANAQAAAVGAPASRPIYFSVDFDATPGQQTAINSYFDGVASVIGVGRTGAYGGYYVIKRLFDAGKIKWGWQTYAWSGGQWDTRAQLRQVQNGITAAGSSNCCDLDHSNADDFGQWGHAPDYEGTYVSQSWPLAATAMKMITGQTVAANIVMKNTGTKTWNSNTRLGTTQPRDHKSVFADVGWLSASRPDAVQGTVAPGGTFKFAFDFHAPDKPGTYHEFFSLVQESVAWFGDPGQGGPADNVIEATIDVVLPNYSGEFVAQSYVGATKGAVPITLGDTVKGWVQLKNVGSQTWKAGVTKLAPTPRDKPSTLGATGWLSPTRVSTVTADVPPGSVGKFELDLTGNNIGDFTQTFALVEESSTWFSDPANGGGPADNFIKVHATVMDQPVPPPSDDGGGVADMGPQGDDAGDTGGTGGTGGTGDTGGNGDTPPATMQASGCSMGGAGPVTVALPLMLLCAALILRRRVR